MSSFLLGALIVFGILFGLTLWSAIIGAPFVKTPKKAIREIFETAKIKPGDKLYDLGAGDGKVLILAEKEFGAQATGFELSPIFWLVAKINLWLSGVKGTNLYLRNFYKQDLSRADAIFCFLSIHGMKKLKSKFEKELKPGTKIISYSFSLPGWQPKKVLDGYPGKVYLYER